MTSVCDEFAKAMLKISNWGASATGAVTSQKSPENGGFEDAQG